MVSYELYKTTYLGGSIPEVEWPLYEGRAFGQLARYKRIYMVTAPDADAESKAVCAMAEALYGFGLIANGEGGPVQSASIGSVSASYSNASGQAIDISPKGQAAELFRCACLYLDIYRGVGRC